MTTGEETVPDGVGPHEGRELELMLSGKKPLAMFCDAVGYAHWFPEDSFAPYVAEGVLVRWETTYHPPSPAVPSRCVYFARTGEEWRIKKIHRIQEEIHVERQPATAGRERDIGRLLGYSETQIDLYLELNRAGFAGGFKP